MKIEELFNKLISEEILAILEYKLISQYLKFSRLTKLANLIDDIIKDEEEHLTELTERAMQLELEISYFSSGKPELAEFKDNGILQPDAIIKKLVKLEDDAVNSYKEALDEDCIEADPTTKQLFKHILEEEYNHDSSFDAEVKKMTYLGVKDWTTTLTEADKNIKTQYGFNVPKAGAHSEATYNLLETLRKRTSDFYRNY